MKPDFDSLFRAHYDHLVCHLTRLCGDGDLAADAAQEAFVRLVTKAPDHGGLREWLFRVATNQLWDGMRRRRRHAAALTTYRDRIPSPTPPLRPDEQLDRAADRLTARGALESLSTRDRTMLLMRAQGFTHAEIARAMGIGTKSVGTMTARALRRMGAAVERREATLAGVDSLG